MVANDPVLLAVEIDGKTLHKTVMSRRMRINKFS